MVSVLDRGHQTPSRWAAAGGPGLSCSRGASDGSSTDGAVACSDGGFGACGFDVMLGTPVPSPSRDRRSVCAENDTGCSADIRNALGDIDATWRGDRGDVLKLPNRPLRRGFMFWMPDGHFPSGVGRVTSRHAPPRSFSPSMGRMVRTPTLWATRSLPGSTFASSTVSEDLKPSR